MSKTEFSIKKHQSGEGWSSVDRIPLSEDDLFRIIAALQSESRSGDDDDLAARLWIFREARHLSAFPEPSIANLKPGDSVIWDGVEHIVRDAPPGHWPSESVYGPNNFDDEAAPDAHELRSRLSHFLNRAKISPK